MNNTNILFSRQNLLRKPEYGINTLIYQMSGKTIVKKYVDSDEAKPHLANFYNNIGIIKKNSTGLDFPRIIKKTLTYVEFEYLNLPSLELLVETALISRQYDETAEYIKKLTFVINSFSSIVINPYKNNNFISFFDPDKKYASDKMQDCQKITALDLNYDNILIGKNNTYLLDYEWVYNFPVPKRYILFRALFYLCHKLQSVIATHCSKELPCIEIVRFFLVPKIWIETLDIKQNDIEKFLSYEYQFQKKIQLTDINFDKTIFLDKTQIHTDRYSLNLEKYLANYEYKNQALQKNVNDLNTLLYIRAPFLFHSRRYFDKIKKLLKK